MTRSLQRYAGMYCAPLAWVVSTQVGQITPYLDCRTGVSWSATFCLGLVTVAVGGLYTSRATWTDRAEAHPFMARVGLMVAVAATFALSIQAVATLVLDPCQR